MAQRKYTIADALGLSGKTSRDLTKGYQREVRAIPRGARYQGAISRSRPTAAQELAQLLTPDTRGGAEFVQKLTPAIENTPLLGGLLSLVDARRQYQAGNTGQAAGLGILAALGAVPGGKGAKAVKDAAENAAERGIIAYHGSPYSFDRFSVSKIGTGEGAQAQGHGLYFAEKEAVAKTYKDLMPASLLSPEDGAGFEARAAFDIAKGDTKKAIKILNDRMKTTKDASQFLTDGGAKQIAEISEAINRIKSGEFKKGNMYQVRINANQNDFIDWDMPLSEQPMAMKALQNLDLSSMKPGNRTRTMLEWAMQGVEQPHNLAIGRDLVNAARDFGEKNVQGSEFLASQGFKGIKYLDQGSREAGKGSRNYVVFDDALIDILKKYGIAIPALVGGGLLATQPQQDGGI